MEAAEIGMVVSENGALGSVGILEDLCIVNRLAGASCFLDGQHIVAKATQLLDERIRKVLVRIEPGHDGSICLVVANVAIDLSSVFAIVIPRGLKVRRRQPHDVVDDLLV